MIDQSTLIVVAVAAVFVTVGVLAWMVDSGVSDKLRVYVKYALFGLFAVVVGLCFMIKDDSEFDYATWTPAKKSGGGGGGVMSGGGGGGDSVQKDSGGSGGDAGTMVVKKGPDSDEGEMPNVIIEEAAQWPLQDCPICPVMVQIQSGSALIGSSVKVAAKGAQVAAASNVSIAREFGIGKFEVTVGQFQAFLRETGYTSSNTCPVGGKNKTLGNYSNPGFGQTSSHPVVCVSWRDAIAYAEWLTQKTGAVYRLPTEIEWEYAARAGVTGPYSVSGTITAEAANFAAKSGDRKGRTSPVGRYPPNGNDMHDVHGNVWELTADCWSRGYLRSGSGTSKKGVDCSRRVAKGGAWFSSVEHLNLAMRVGVKSDFANNGLGFRVLREVEQETGGSGPLTQGTFEGG